MRIEDLKVIARSLGIDYDQHGTSHVIFRHSNAGRLSVPAHRPIKPVYVRLFVEFVSSVGENNKIDKALISTPTRSRFVRSPRWTAVDLAIEYPDLPGCISDGETPEEALKQGSDAVKAYLMNCVKHGDADSKRRARPVGNGGNACLG